MDDSSILPLQLLFGFACFCGLIGILASLRPRLEGFRAIIYVVALFGIIFSIVFLFLSKRNDLMERMHLWP